MAKAKQASKNRTVQGPPASAERVLLPIEAAVLLRISLDQLYHLTSKKKIPFTKVGGALRFDRLQLLDFIASGSVNSDQVPGGTGRGPRKAGGRGSNGAGQRKGPQTSERRFTFNTPPRPRPAREK